MMVNVFSMDLQFRAGFNIPMQCPLLAHDLYLSTNLVIVAFCVTNDGGYMINTYIYRLFSATKFNE